MRSRVEPPRMRHRLLRTDPRRGDGQEAVGGPQPRWDANPEVAAEPSDEERLRHLAGRYLRAAAEGAGSVPTVDFPGQIELQHRIRRACLDEDARPIVFVLGSGASRGSIPETGGMVDYFEKSIASDPEDLGDFQEQVRALGEQNQYQAGARFLIERAGLTHLNRVIRLAVLGARTPALPADLARTYTLDESRLKDLEDDYAGWAVPQGISAIARLLSRVPVEVRGPILTTNFDPLLEIALRTNGLDSYPIVADGDGAFSYPESSSAVVPVAHLHGFWRLGDTLHTAAQLERARPKLIGSLRQILTNSTCVVLGYGGWDDVLTSSILRLVEEGNQRMLEVLWGCHGSDPGLGALTGTDLPGRIQPYVEVDINTVMPAVDMALSTRSSGKLSAGIIQRNKVALGGCTLIDDEFVRLQRERVVTEERALAFFDGREPNWTDVLNDHTAKLARSDELLQQARDWSFPLPGLLVEGPTGEGKSTLLRQLAVALSGLPEFQVWWANQGDRIEVEQLLSLSVTTTRNCLFIDDADLQVPQAAEILRRVNAENRDDIRVFLASRDTDWKRSTARHSIAPNLYSRRVVAGIDLKDARHLVELWSKWGSRGLGRLASVTNSIDGRATHLHEQSLGASSSALLGALLTTRYGDEFKGHIRDLLARLDRVSLPGNHTLLDAYLIVCAVDHLQLGSAAIEHLAWALDMTESEVSALVVTRLGFEAAAQRHGDFLAPRHPKIASTACQLAVEFGKPLENVLRNYVSAVTRGSVGSRWGDETLAIVFAGQRLEEQTLALAAIEGAVMGDPSQLRLRNAQIGVYRQFDLTDNALTASNDAWAAFPELSDTHIAKRGFFTQWARVVGVQGDYAGSAALNACALLDLPHSDSIDEYHASRALSGLALSLNQFTYNTHEEQTKFVGVCAEEAISISPDGEVRAQAERTLGRAVQDGYQTVASRGDRKRLIRTAVRHAVNLSPIGPAPSLRRQGGDTNDLLRLLALD